MAQDAALRKRQQIAKANRTMFIWVAVTSVVVSISVVVSWILIQKLIFNERVIAKKSEAASVLQENNKAAQKVLDAVRVLNTNDTLRTSLANDESQPVQAILDALPSEPNSSALGSSLQTRLLSGDGITIESLTVDPIDGVEGDSSDSGSEDSAGPNEISFRFSVSAARDNPDALVSLLRNIELSIRAINLTSLNVETQGSKLVLTANGVAYFEPAKTVDLQTKTEKP